MSVTSVLLRLFAVPEFDGIVMESVAVALAPLIIAGVCAQVVILFATTKEENDPCWFCNFVNNGLEATCPLLAKSALQNVSSVLSGVERDAIREISEKTMM